jgi:hypothetical protein
MGQVDGTVDRQTKPLGFVCGISPAKGKFEKLGAGRS